MRTLLIVSAVAFSACAPDYTPGTYDFTLTGTDTETAPRSQTSTPAGGGTMAITVGKKVDYLITLSQTDASPCVLEADRNDKGDAVNITAAQKCTFVYSGGTVTATINTGTVSVSDKGETATVNVAYSYAGTIIGINFAGTGTRTYAGPRR